MNEFMNNKWMVWQLCSEYPEWIQEALPHGVLPGSQVQITSLTSGSQVLVMDLAQMRELFINFYHTTYLSSSYCVFLVTLYNSVLISKSIQKSDLPHPGGCICYLLKCNLTFL